MLDKFENKPFRDITNLTPLLQSHLNHPNSPQDKYNVESTYDSNEYIKPQLTKPIFSPSQVTIPRCPWPNEQIMDLAHPSL